MPEIAKYNLSKDDRNAVQLVQDRLQLSIDRYGGQNNMFRELNRFYLGLTPHVSNRENDRPNESHVSKTPDLFVQRSFALVEGATPMWVFGVLGGHPPIKVYSRKKDYLERAESLQALVTYDFDRSDVLYRSIHVAKQMFKYGTGIAKVGYKFDSYNIKRAYERSIPKGFNQKDDPVYNRRDVTKDEEVVRYDGPWIEPWSVYNFHPDPYYQDIKDMRYVCAARWTDLATLELENEQHRKLIGRDKYKNLDKIPRTKKGQINEVYHMDNGDDLAEAMGWTNSFNYRGNRYTGQGGTNDQYEDLIHIIEYWDRDDRVVYLAQGETPILDSENPYDDKEIPFIAARNTVLDNNFWGYGILHATRRTQEEMNSLRNLNMRQAQLNILNVWGFDESIGVPQTLTNLNPGGLYPIPFHANGNPGLVPLIQGRPLPPEAYQYEDRLDMDMQLAAGMPGYRSGVGGEGGTATEATLQEQQSKERSRLQSLHGSLTYAAEIARFFISRRQQFLKDEGEEIRITGAEGVSFKFFTRQDIEGEYDFVPGGGHVHPGKDVLRQQLLQLIAVTAQNPVLTELTDMPEVWEETWKMFDFDYPQRFLNPPVEKNPFAERPDWESRVLLQSEWIKATPNENHEQHLQEHQQALMKAVSEGDQKAIEVIKGHMQQHKQYLMQQQAQQAQQQQAQGGGTPPQEQAGLRGFAGNVPNMENATESEAGLAARVGGGSRGGVV